MRGLTSTLGRHHAQGGGSLERHVPISLLTAMGSHRDRHRVRVTSELPDGRLKLIDGHLRRDLDPDMEVEVEVLDVTEDEARTLLLSIDPLAALAETQQQLRGRLQELVPEELRLAWEASARAEIKSPPSPTGWAKPTITEQYAVLVTCRDEAQQVELLHRFQQEGLACKALLS